jgi:hypothetical protein
MRYEPDVNWHPDFKIIPPPTDHAYTSALECFDTKGRLLPGSRDKAYSSLKALAHCLLQDNVRVTSIPNLVSDFHRPDLKGLEHLEHHDLDDHLKNALEVCNHITGWRKGQSHETDGLFNPVIDVTTFSHPHLLWISRTLVHYM